jgi:hypothetical protein
MTSTSLLVVSLIAAAAAVSQTPSPQNPPAASELEYETYCKKEEKEKRRLFRAATPDQQSTLARTQIERWRDANRAQLSQEQVKVLQELWTMAVPAMFERTAEGKAKLADFEARADAAFSGAEMDAISPYGPCIATKPDKEAGGRR